ncbi:MAG TPA: DoxX family protein [Kiloniellales bacterium]|nr:DoxX family protein [Kiloniellales bacterium]
MTMTTTAAPDGLLVRVGALYARIGSLLDRYLGPVAEVAARYWLGLIFFRSGLGRATDWSSQEFLFESIHPLPGIPPSVAAVVTTAGELVLPILLWLGLGQRLAALGLFAMTAVIQFIVAQTPEGIENHIGNLEHYAWMVGFLLLATRAPSVLTLDHWLCRRCAGSHS